MINSESLGRSGGWDEGIWGQGLGKPSYGQPELRSSFFCNAPATDALSSGRKPNMDRCREAHRTGAHFGSFGGPVWMYSVSWHSCFLLPPPEARLQQQAATRQPLQHSNAIYVSLQQVATLSCSSPTKALKLKTRLNCCSGESSNVVALIYGSSGKCLGSLFKNPCVEQGLTTKRHKGNFKGCLYLHCGSVFVRVNFN